MKRTIQITTLILALFTSILVSGQRPYCGRGFAGQMQDSIAGILNLTEEQKENFFTIHEEHFAAMEQIRNNTELTVPARHRAMAEQWEKKDAAIKDLLSPEQLEILERHRKEMRDKRPFRGGRKGWLQHRGCWLLNDQIPREILEMRVELEASLSEEEKILIADMREEWKEQRPAGKGNGFRGKRGFRHHRWQNGNNSCLLKPLSEIVEDHRDALEDYLYRAVEISMENCPRRRGRMEAPAGERPGSSFERRAFHFLMIDPVLEENILSGEESPVSLYPNPAGSELTIEFTTEKDGEVTVELVSKNGNHIETIDRSLREAGKHKIVFNTEKLPDNEVYLIRIMGGGKTMSEKFIRMK